MVPEHIRGVWRRASLTAPGVEDTTTQVVWVQSRSWYADLRVPARRPDSVSSLADCTREQLAALARVEGFGGQLQVSGDICSWRRDLDFQLPGPWPDEGRYAVLHDRLIETGIHTPYEEDWRTQPDASAPLLAFELADDSAAPSRRGLLVVAGDHFISILDRSSPLPQGTSLAALLAAGAPADVLEMPICYGRIGDGGWRVSLASLPWLEGRSLWAGGSADYDPASGLLTWRGANGSRAWRTLDSTLPPSELQTALRLAAATAAT